MDQLTLRCSRKRKCDCCVKPPGGKALSTLPFEVPDMRNSRLGLVGQGQLTCQWSNRAYSIARAESTGRSVALCADMTKGTLAFSASAFATKPSIRTGDVLSPMDLLKPYTCWVMQSKEWHGSSGPPSICGGWGRGCVRGGRGPVRKVQHPRSQLDAQQSRSRKRAQLTAS